MVVILTCLNVRVWCLGCFLLFLGYLRLAFCCCFFVFVTGIVAWLDVYCWIDLLFLFLWVGNYWLVRVCLLW